MSESEGRVCRSAAEPIAQGSRRPALCGCPLWGYPFLGTQKGVCGCGQQAHNALVFLHPPPIHPLKTRKSFLQRELGDFWAGKIPLYPPFPKGEKTVQQKLCQVHYGNNLDTFFENPAQKSGREHM